MALRNDYNPEDLTSFKNRLMSLMVERQTDSAKKLAEALYKHALVTVNSVDDFVNKEKSYNNAIGSIEKKILRHLKEDTAAAVQGEYIVAYSKFFGCSTDYITGLTDIKTSDINIKKICEFTGLTENSVRKISKSTLIPYRDYINKMLELKSFDELLLSMQDYDDKLPSSSRENPYEERLKVFSKETLEIAHSLVGCVEEELIDIAPSQEVLDAMSTIEKAIDFAYAEDCRKDYDTKVYLYNIQKDLQSLFNDLCSKSKIEV